MTELTLHRRPVTTVFDLLGTKEDDITYSLGWALSQSERLAHALLAEIFETSPEHVDAIRLQELVPGAGRTDVEIEAGNLHLIIEAKRGWTLPTTDQLELYAPRISAGRDPTIAVVSECSREFATRPGLSKEVGGVPVRYLPWSKVVQLVADTADADGAGHAEKRLLRELLRYLKGVMTLQDPTSNMVYVVSIGTGSPWSGVSSREIVLERERYFHPVGGGRGGWPKTPPNYLGFRFDGRLQQIRHVDSYEVVTKPGEHFPEAADDDWSDKPHYLYRLGPPIEPTHRVRSGKVTQALRVWAALDLLLTCESISEARDRTQERIEATGLQP